MQYIFTFLILLSSLFGISVGSLAIQAQTCGDREIVCDYMVADSGLIDNILVDNLQDSQYLAFAGSTAGEVLDSCRFSFGVECSDGMPMDYDLDQNIPDPNPTDSGWTLCSYNSSINCPIENIPVEGDPNFVGPSLPYGPQERESNKDCSRYVFDTECVDILVPAPYTTSLDYRCGNDGQSLNRAIISDKQCKKEFEKNNPYFNTNFGPINIPVPVPKNNSVPIFVPQPKRGSVAPEQGLTFEQSYLFGDLEEFDFTDELFLASSFDNN